MIKSPCLHEENYVRIDCERRCVGCRKTCKEWKEYQAAVDAEREQKKVARILNEMNRDRMDQKGDNAMKRMMKRRKNNG